MAGCTCECARRRALASHPGVSRNVNTVAQHTAVIGRICSSFDAGSAEAGTRLTQPRPQVRRVAHCLVRRRVSIAMTVHLPLPLPPPPPLLPPPAVTLLLSTPPLAAAMLRQAARRALLAAQQHQQRSGMSTTVAAAAVAGAARRLALGVPALGLGTFAAVTDEPHKVAYRAAMIPVRLGRDVWAAASMLAGELWARDARVQRGLGGGSFGLLVSAVASMLLPPPPAPLTTPRLRLDATRPGGGGAGGSQEGVPPARRRPPASCLLRQRRHLHQAGPAHRHAGAAAGREGSCCVR